MITAKVLADSVNIYEDRITTVEYEAPRFILAQINTHRVFSRNAASSRAIPTAKIIERVLLDPVIPVSWGRNQKGMVAGGEVRDPDACLAEWMEARDAAVYYAGKLAALGVAKETVNRILEPWMWVKGIITSTEWHNFFSLRIAHDAQPEFRDLAIAIKTARDASEPVLRDYDDWHIPFADGIEGDLERQLQIATARCARISYATHDGVYSLAADLALHHSLLEHMHMSPFEHCATPAMGQHANFTGWQSYRNLKGY